MDIGKVEPTAVQPCRFEKAKTAISIRATGVSGPKMQNIATHDTTVANGIRPRPQRLLIRLDRWLARLSMTQAVTVLTGAAADSGRGLRPLRAG